MCMLQMSTRRGSTDVHEFEGMFLGFRAQFKVTSVIGHVFRSLFSQKSPQKLYFNQYYTSYFIPLNSTFFVYCNVLVQCRLKCIIWSSLILIYAFTIFGCIHVLSLNDFLLHVMPSVFFLCNFPVSTCSLPLIKSKLVHSLSIGRNASSS